MQPRDQGFWNLAKAMKKPASGLLLPFVVASAVCALVVAEDYFGESSHWPEPLSGMLLPIRLPALMLSLLLCKAVPAFDAGLHAGFHSPPSGPLVYSFVFLLTFMATLIVRSIFRRPKA